MLGEAVLPSRNCWIIGSPGSLYHGERLPVLRFGRCQILVRDIDLVFKPIQLGIIIYRPPGSARNIVLGFAFFQPSTSL